VIPASFACIAFSASAKTSVSVASMRAPTGHFGLGRG
jgi:hypothetical protein